MSTPTVEILRKQLREKFPEACGAWQGRVSKVAAALEAGEPLVPLRVGEAATPFGVGGTSNTVALAPANELAWAGTVSPSGPREWLANDRTMNLRSDGLHGQVHSQLIRRTVAENGPCHAAADGLPALDFPAGTLTEVVGAGAGWVIAALLESVIEEPGASEMVLVDGADGFDPASFSARVCARLLWVRCRQSAMEMIKAADWVVRDGNVPLVLVDATGLARRELAKVPTAAWWRLKQSTERTGCRLVVVAQTELVPSAGLRWRLSMGLELVDFAASREELLGRWRPIPQRLRQVT